MGTPHFNFFFIRAALIKKIEMRRTQRSNEVKITERAVRLELSLQHRPDAILNLGGLLCEKPILISGSIFGVNIFKKLTFLPLRDQKCIIN